MKKLFMLAAIVVVALSCVVIAQEQKPQPSVVPKIDAATLLLEITENRSLPPAYSAVNSPGQTRKGIWVTRFGRIPGRPAPPGKPIGAIKFEPVFNGETVDVRITLLRGSKGFEQEDLVGVYQVALGEQKAVTDLDQFGIEPVYLSLLNTVSPLPPNPAFDNPMKAIEIVSVQGENVPKPSYKIVLRNVSDKSILAVKVETLYDGHRGGSALLQGEDGRALLPPGGVSEQWLLASRTQRTPTGYAPGTPSAVTIAIRTVIFDDLSYEGESESACTMAGFVMGRRLWLKRVLPVLDQEISKSNNDNVEALKQFRGKVSELSLDLEESELKKGSSAACSKLSDSATVAFNGMKMDLLSASERVITAKPINLKSWMEEKRARYSAWLARL